jgi:hypothetical protein
MTSLKFSSGMGSHPKLTGKSEARIGGGSSFEILNPEFMSSRNFFEVSFRPTLLKMQLPER